MNALGNSIARPKTKIVCTLGPSTASDETIRGLIVNGMSVARLNLSHGSPDAHRAAINQVRAASDELNTPVGIMIDVPGPKYRTGYQDPGVLDLVEGAAITLTSREVRGNPKLLSVSPHGIHRDAVVGGAVFVDDGNVKLVVQEISGEDVICQVTFGGRVTERRGVAIPGKAPALPFLDERAKNGLNLAADVGADFIALSNVTRDIDVNLARELLRERGPEPYIISKIETAEALDNFSEILDASDAIMVARGDMGVEVPLARVPVIQKQLIAQCNRGGKPVITATQMLESMIKSPTPTRAEVTDIANAIYDGTDAIMLSGETAAGGYPVQAIETMRDVALQAEAALPYANMIREKYTDVEDQTDDAISYDACRTAFQLKARLIVAFTESGSTAGRVSQFRPEAHILALTPSERVRKQLTLRWGVTPLIVGGLESVDDFFAVGEDYALKSGWIQGRGKVVLVAGVTIGLVGGTDLLHVMDVPSGRASGPA